jgi:hypothetical protein
VEALHFRVPTFDPSRYASSVLASHSTTPSSSSSPAAAAAVASSSSHSSAAAGDGVCDSASSSSSAGLAASSLAPYAAFSPSASGTDAAAASARDFADVSVDMSVRLHETDDSPSEWVPFESVPAVAATTSVVPEYMNSNRYCLLWCGGSGE